MEAAEAKRSSPAKIAFMVLGVAAGLATANYAGNKAIFPILAFVVFIWAVDRILKPAARPLGLAVSLLAADVVWLGLLLILTGIRGHLNVVAYVLLTVAALAWLARRPGLAPAVAVTLVQIAFSVRVVQDLAPSAYGTDLHRVALVHVVLRVLGVIALYMGLYQILTGKTEPVDVPDETPPPPN
jgi:hypothetical protein